MGGINADKVASNYKESPQMMKRVMGGCPLLCLRCPNRWQFQIQPASNLKSQWFRIPAISVAILLQQFPRVTSIGSLPPTDLGKSRGPPQNPAEPHRTLGGTPAEPSERPRRALWEANFLGEPPGGWCARMVTLRNFRNMKSQWFRIPAISVAILLDLPQI